MRSSMQFRTMRVWALISRRSSETVELFLDEEAAYSALADVLLDEPSLASLVNVIELDWALDALTAKPSSN